jgi:tRNA A-37 threonylcarbamoyl transferase component Bud32
LDNDFEKIRQNNCTLYIHKQFANDCLAQGLLAGEEKLRELYVLKAIPSSESTRTDKFNISINGTKKEIYLKQYLCGSGLRFIKSIFRRSRARRAFEAALMLAKNGFDTSEVVAMGERRNGFFNGKSFLATFAVENSKAIYQLIPEDSRVSNKEQLRSWRQLIQAFGRTVGRMHAKGIFHGDLRLGNVLARQEENYWRFFFLDNERTKKFDRLPFNLRVRNLVQVNMVRKANLSNTDRMRFFREYCAETKISKKQNKSLAEKVIEKTNRRLNKKILARRELRRCLRANARYLRVKTAKYLAVFNRNFCEGAEPIDFIQQIDSLMDKGQILKNDKTSYVSRLMWNGRDIVVKRYNHRGFTHSLRHTIKGSRARRAWLNAHRLRMLQIATPKPLAYIEQWKGLLVWKSYLVTEYVKGQKLYDFLRDSNITKEEHIEVTRQVTELLDKLGKYRITHGDLKHTNILITENGPVLTDLDAMKIHRLKCAHRWKARHDFASFSKRLSSCNYGSVHTGT